jgi:hypothetical protein
MASNRLLHIVALVGALFLMIGALLVPTTFASASKKTPTANELAQKLVKAHICATIKPAATTDNAVDRFPRGTTSPVSVYAFTKKTAMLPSLTALQETVCASLPSSPNMTFTLDYVVGPTWYVMPVSTPVSSRAVAKTLGGKLKPHTCR